MAGAKFFAWVVMLALAVLVAYISRYYIIGAVEQFRLGPDAAGEAIAFRLHVGGGVVALVAGPWQFLSFIRERFPVIHRWIGRAYVAGVVVSIAGACVLALHPITGSQAVSFAFFALAFMWAVTTGQALRMILKRDFDAHQQWMTRSYALTFAAITLRIGVLGLHLGAGFSQADAYITAAWASWAFNLIVAEWFFVRPLKNLTAGPASAHP